MISPNDRFQPLLEVGVTEEQTREAVGWKPVFGLGLGGLTSTLCLRECSDMQDFLGMHRADVVLGQG